MFTGIVRAVGRIDSRREGSQGAALTVRSGEFAGRLSAGDSIAVNGVCQTVESVSGGSFTFTAVGETLRRTTMGGLAVGSEVNLENAATPESALSGHLVQGHVDGVGKVGSFTQRGRDRLLTVHLPEDAARYVVPRGAITIDGVSLTIVDAGPGSKVTTTIVPFTMENTIMRNYRVGTPVNIEADIVGKYVREYMLRIRDDESGSHRATFNEVKR